MEDDDEEEDANEVRNRVYTVLAANSSLDDYVSCRMEQMALRSEEPLMMMMMRTRKKVATMTRTRKKKQTRNKPPPARRGKRRTKVLRQTNEIREIVVESALILGSIVSGK